MANLPEHVQIVLMDIAFNTGVRGLGTRSNLQRLRDAVDARNFEEAAIFLGSGSFPISRHDRNIGRAAMMRGGA